MLRWLAEKRFIRRTNIGRRRRLHDELSFADAAQAASGVTMGKKKSVEPAEATLIPVSIENINSDFEFTEIEALDMNTKQLQWVKGCSIVYRPTFCRHIT